MDEAAQEMNQIVEAKTLSICIVGIDAEVYLRNCLQSIFTSGIEAPYEVIYVDNGSTDGTRQMLENEFPNIQTVWNGQNLGYARANNQAIVLSQSSFVMLLNPDTIVTPGSIGGLLEYMILNPEIGIIGPKVLNSDGSFQAHCKRGEARPWEAFCYFSGLAKLFPRSRCFAGYLQGFLDEDEVNEVPALSGSCMLIRRDVIDQIGLLDERFFAYQEDTDYCVQARKAGWKVVYYPKAVITHFGGKGGASAQPYKTIVEWHLSYYRYYKKNLAKDYFFLFNWLFYLVMGVKLLLSLTVNFFRPHKHPGPKRG
jgi:GT2 family glycosyltransferase